MRGSDWRRLSAACDALAAEVHPGQWVRHGPAVHAHFAGADPLPRLAREPHPSFDRARCNCTRRPGGPDFLDATATSRGNNPCRSF